MRWGWERAQHRAQGKRNQEHRSLLPKTPSLPDLRPVTHTHPKQQEPRLGRVITATGQRPRKPF